MWQISQACPQTTRACHSPPLAGVYSSRPAASPSPPHPNTELFTPLTLPLICPRLGETAVLPAPHAWSAFVPVLPFLQGYGSLMKFLTMEENPEEKNTTRHYIIVSMAIGMQRVQFFNNDHPLVQKQHCLTLIIFE